MDMPKYIYIHGLIQTAHTDIEIMCDLAVM